MRAGTTHHGLPGDGQQPPAWALAVADPVCDCPGCGRDSCEGCVPGRALGESLLDLALSLHALGYGVLPVTAKKKPLVKWYPFRLARPTAEQVHELFSCRGVAGVALLCGRSHGLVVVDADDATSATWVRANLPATRWTWTRRGLHAHFRHPSYGLIRTDCRQGDRGGDPQQAPVRPSAAATPRRKKAPQEQQVSTESVEFRLAET